MCLFRLLQSTDSTLPSHLTIFTPFLLQRPHTLEFADCICTVLFNLLPFYVFPVNQQWVNLLLSSALFLVNWQLGLDGSSDLGTSFWQEYFLCGTVYFQSPVGCVLQKRPYPLELDEDRMCSLQFACKHPGGRGVINTFRYALTPDEAQQCVAVFAYTFKNSSMASVSWTNTKGLLAYVMRK